MRRVEKKLIQYINGTGRKIREVEIYNYAAHDSNVVLDSLFKVIHYGIDTTTGEQSLDKVCELVNNVKSILENYDDVNRGIVDRKLAKIDEKISCVLIEKQQSFKDVQRATKELEKLRTCIEDVLYRAILKNSNQYEFMDYLIDSIKNLDYIEFAIGKVPSLVNVKDKDGKRIIQHVLERYCEAMKKNSNQDIHYYYNLITLLLTRKNFIISRKEKRACLESIYHAIDSFYSEKGVVNSQQIQALKELVERIRKYDDQISNIIQIADQYQIAMIFPKKIEEQIQLLPGVNDSKRKRVDEVIVTIDKKNALVLDDGYSCRKLSNGNYLLGIHSVSVLGYFPYQSNIVDEAISRNRNIYLPVKYQNKKNDFNQMISIFPYSFAALKASLIPNQDKYARSYFFEISSDGEIVQEYFFPSIIQSSKKLSFDDVNTILKNGSKEEKIQDVLMSLQEVDRILAKKYKKVEFYDQLKDQQGDVSCLEEDNIRAQKIIYDNILLLGNRVATYFATNGYPCLYRVMDKNEDYKNVQNKVKSFPKIYGINQYKKIAASLKEVYPTGGYALSGSHDGLHLDHYCCCASELRKGAAIVNEHCLEVCCDKQPTDLELAKLENEVQKRAEELNASQYPIDWFLNDCKKIYRKSR